MANYSYLQLEVLRKLLNGCVVESCIFNQGKLRGFVYWNIEVHRYSCLVHRKYSPISICRPVSHRYVSIDAFLHEFFRLRNDYVTYFKPIDDIPF